MKIDKISVDAVRYNPEFGAFETLVKIHDRGHTYSYPAQVTASLHVEMDVILRNLAQAAVQTHKAGRKAPADATRIHHAASTTPYSDGAGSQSLLGRIFGQAAA